MFLNTQRTQMKKEKDCIHWTTLKIRISAYQRHKSVNENISQRVEDTCNIHKQQRAKNIRIPNQ